MITIIPVSNKKQLQQFIDFPHELYKGDPNYVPELFIAQRDILSPGKHPFHEHSSLQGFLAIDGNEIKGRIAAIINNNHNSFNKVNEGFFGFFDCVNDKAVAESLISAATAWLKEKKVTSIVGPVNPTTNDTCGLLVDGFDSPPMAMMTYNKPYYLTLLEELGFTKKTDLLAYFLPTDKVNERSVNLMGALQQRLKNNNIIIRQIDMKNFASETAKLKEVYNSAWDKNMGFVPMTDKEFGYLAKDLKMILDPKYCLVAEQEGKIVGFGLAIPDINQILIKIKKGRLLPTGLFKLLLGKKKINQVRILALGVIDGYKKMGIEACFYAMMINRAKEKGLKGGEASWILEHNDLMNKGILSMNGQLYKRYRLLEKTI